MRPVILDRDGVINEDSDAYIKSVDEWIPIPGSIEAIARLSRAGFAVFVATNQSGLGRGYFGQSELDQMHAKMSQLIGLAGGDLAGIYYCPHKPEDNCSCRKPAPGLLDRICKHLGVDTLSGIPVVGDSLRDLLAGTTRGCRPIMVRTGKGLESEPKLAQYPELSDTLVFDDLSAVADFLITHENAE